ncbi:hypothetical protein [Roseateles sp. LYH14W]
MKPSIGLSLLLTSLSCAAVSPRVGPCKAEQLAGSWAGVSALGDGVAVLLILQPDKSGHFEIWAKEKNGVATTLQRRIEAWDAAADGTISFRNPPAPAERSVTALKAASVCVVDRPSTMNATFWVQDIAYAELTLEPLDTFLARRRHLEQFYRAIGAPH